MKFINKDLIPFKNDKFEVELIMEKYQTFLYCLDFTLKI